MSPFFYIMRAQLLFLLLISAIFSACGISTRTPQNIPLTTPNPTAVPLTETAQKIPVVQFIVPTVLDTTPGAPITITMQFAPMYLEIGTTPGGASYTSMTSWENANITEMRVCMEIEKQCASNGAWMNYQPEWNFEFNTDWLGERRIWVAAQFRDGAGNNIRAYNLSGTPMQNEFGATEIYIRSTLDERTPISAQPAFVQTAVAATRAAYPVTGSLVLQNGMCCAGGKLGTKIEITADFDAASPNTAVTQMRLMHHCGKQSEMNTMPWEPFVKQKIFPYTISAPNWIGWYLAVQYRDANGNLSPIYCDDLSIEGMPK